MAVNILERIYFQPVQGQIVVVLIPLQNTSPFQKIGNSLNGLM